MNEYLALFSTFFIVAIIPGPLAIIAFYGGTRGIGPFLAGLLGQLSGLIIVSNLIAFLGVKSGITDQSWFLPLGAIALIWLGYRIITAERKGRPKDSLTFASTFLMAASNPKAILGFGPPLLWFHRDGVTIPALFQSTGILIAAVSLSMLAYFILGMMLKSNVAVKYIRQGAGMLIALLGALVLVREITKTLS